MIAFARRRLPAQVTAFNRLNFMGKKLAAGLFNSPAASPIHL